MVVSIAQTGLVVGLLVGLGGASVAAAEPTSDELWVIVHPNNSVGSLDDHTLFDIFTGARRFWADRTPIVPLNAPAGTPSRVLFDETVLQMSPIEVGRFWIDQRVRGRAQPPRKAPLPRIAIGTVLRLEGAIAYVPAGTCVRGAKIIARVRSDGVLTRDAPKEDQRCDS